MSPRQEITDRMSGAIADQKEEAIITCVREVVGYDDTLFALAGRGDLTVYPDGSEVFSFDGRPLLRFGPVEFEHFTEGDAFKVRATRSVQRLNSQR